MAVKFSEFAIGTIDADLELVGFDSATPENVQVSYSDIKTDILSDAQSPLNGTGFVKISGTVISYDNSTYLTNVGIANLTATGTPSATTFLRGDNTWATPSGGPATMAIGSTITSSTVGSVLFVGTGGLLAQNNANFFWNNTTLRLGIGTTAPTRKLDVNGDITINQLTAGRGVSNLTSNTAFGTNALNTAPTGAGGNNNTGIGFEVLKLNNFGYDNTGVGFNALAANTSGQANVAIGKDALTRNTTGTGNIAIGTQTATLVTGANRVIAIGYQAFRDGITGNNIYIGENSGVTHSNASCTNNTLVGHLTGQSSTTMSGCTALGQTALGTNSTGNNNIGIGYNAGSNQTTGSNNIYLGTGTTAVSGADSNRMFLGNDTTVTSWIGGNLLLGSKTDTGQRLQCSGTIRINGQTAATAGGSAGLHLILNLDGTNYKIALLNV